MRIYGALPFSCCIIFLSERILDYGLGTVLESTRRRIEWIVSNLMQEEKVLGDSTECCRYIAHYSAEKIRLMQSYYLNLIFIRSLELQE